ncbi:MAG: hypothetical protein OMM_03702 [Candidatus Magnetoglobus multicellularis str. Araruama]|uniref:Phosphoadenosine phosphosulphate reductase domain-containing protein n=1 Tax=Candidatus Magnetoglobus multicellularis str. Araruama TaxID=890399 RepID=A0A1V1P4W9_9BACT|nr:MAG: hypothetical protein OMM_03702 [Candidatus Magnetoglobus multicellularis str. Araruama]
MIPKKWKYLLDSPFEISSYCCTIMKKLPFSSYETKSRKKPFIGTMAIESNARKRFYLKSGCNSFDAKKPKSTPLAFWNEEDIWAYIKKYDIEYSKIYDMGYERTGCMFCMFGVQYDDEPNRFQRMRQTHPRQHNYCINKLGCGKVLDFIGVNYDDD